MPVNDSIHGPDDPEMRRRRLGRDEAPETEAHARHGRMPGQQDDPEFIRALQDDDEGPEVEAHMIRR